MLPSKHLKYNIWICKDLTKISVLTSVNSATAPTIKNSCYLFTSGVISISEHTMCIGVHISCSSSCASKEANPNPLTWFWYSNRQRFFPDLAITCASMCICVCVFEHTLSMTLIVCRAFATHGAEACDCSKKHYWFTLSGLGIIGT